MPLSREARRLAGAVVVVDLAFAQLRECTVLRTGGRDAPGHDACDPMFALTGWA